MKENSKAPLMETDYAVITIRSKEYPEYSYMESITAHVEPGYRFKNLIFGNDSILYNPPFKDNITNLVTKRIKELKEQTFIKFSSKSFNKFSSKDRYMNVLMCTEITVDYSIKFIDVGKYVKALYNDKDIYVTKIVYKDKNK